MIKIIAQAAILSLFGVFAVLLRRKRRRRLLDLDWPSGYNHIQLSKRVQAFLNLHDIESNVLNIIKSAPGLDNHGIFDLKIPRTGSGRIPFMFVCRDNSEIVGETFFLDLAQVWTPRKNQFVAVLLTRSPLDRSMEIFAESWRIPYLSISELKLFVDFFYKAGTVRTARYEGRSPLMESYLMNAQDVRAKAIALQDQARIDEKRGDWASAASRWRECIALDKSRWPAYVGLARDLQAQGMFDEADAILQTAASLFPEELHVAVELAKAAQAKEDWPEALDRWERVIADFSDSWLGFRGKIAALSGSGQQKEADNLLEAHAPLFPDNPDALKDVAQHAERGRDWPRAAAGYKSFLVKFPGEPWAFVGLCRVQLAQRMYTEAESTYQDAIARFPKNPEIARIGSKISEDSQDWPAAARRWRRVSELQQSTNFDAALGEASALRRQKLVVEADRVILQEIRGRANEAQLHEALGLNAMAAESWAEALARFEAAEAMFPSDNRFRGRAFEARLRLADSGSQTPAPRPAAADLLNASAEDRDLVTAFESLGGTGHGCEFGIFQRQFGAEPLGLLRWADLSPEHLSTALETEFAGVGEPEFTNVFVPEMGGKPEYWTTDTRYHMAMRCFVLVEDVPIERMVVQVTRRLRFLRGKLIDDLREGTKIFVYKNMKRNLSDAELARLHSACRRYGDNTLLYIRYQDGLHACGSVVAPQPGLLIGYIDHFSHTPDTDQPIKPATESFITICRLAYKMSQQSAE